MTVIPQAFLVTVQGLDGGTRGHVFGMQSDKVSLWVEMLPSSSAEVLGTGSRD